MEKNQNLKILHIIKIINLKQVKIMEKIMKMNM